MATSLSQDGEVAFCWRLRVTTEELALLVIELKQTVEELKGEVRRISAPASHGQTWLPLAEAANHLQFQGVKSPNVLRTYITHGILGDAARNVGVPSKPRWEVCIELAGPAIARYKNASPEARQSAYGC
jgi:hypothetical protein